MSKKFRAKLAEAGPIWRTFKKLVRDELVLRIELAFAAATLVLSFLLGISRTEWLVVLLTIGAVLAVELLNCAIEELCDHVTPELHPRVAKVKESAAAASAVLGIFAIVIGLIIFIPHFLSLL